MFLILYVYWSTQYLGSRLSYCTLYMLLLWAWPEIKTLLLLLLYIIYIYIYIYIYTYILRLPGYPRNVAYLFYYTESNFTNKHHNYIFIILLVYMLYH